MLMTVVLVFCLGSSGECVEHRPMGDALTSLMSCLVEGQQMAGQWLEDHPGWTLSRLRCEAPRAHDEPSR